MFIDYGVPLFWVHFCPLLFLIYLNDFHCNTNTIKLLLHADDITMYIFVTDINNLINTVS